MAFTMFNSDMQVIKHYEEVLKWCKTQPGKPTPWVTMLYGSQNYGLDSAESDVDTKTMLLPSLGMVIGDTKRISTEIVMPDGSLDNCKDLREMFGNYLKGNINFVETLYTRHWLAHTDYMSEFRQLREHRDLIANAQPQKLMHMACGMARQKYVAFDKPFEGKLGVLEKYGYDPKQLHHLVRLYFFMKTYLRTCDFEKALSCCQQEKDPALYEYLMSLKLEPLSKEDAEKVKEEMIRRVELLCDQSTALPEDNGYAKAKDFLDTMAYDLVKRHLIHEMKEETRKEAVKQTWR